MGINAQLKFPMMRWASQQTLYNELENMYPFVPTGRGHDEAVNLMTSVCEGFCNNMWGIELDIGEVVIVTDFFPPFSTVLNK